MFREWWTAESHFEGFFLRVADAGGRRRYVLKLVKEVEGDGGYSMDIEVNNGGKDDGQMSG